MATRTLSELEVIYNNPSEAFQATVLATNGPDKFHERGAKIDSLRVLTDVRKLFPTAIQIFEDATPAQRKRLRGVGPMLFGLCVMHWAKLEAMWATQEGSVTGDRGVRQVGTVTLADAHRTAMFERTLAVAALGALVGADPQRKLALEVATGRADTDESLAQGLASLAALGMDWANEPDLAEVAADTGIDAEWAADLEAASQALRNAMEADTRRMTVQVSQARLDHQDGVVLHLLGKLIKVYDAANNIDPRILRLTPLSTMGMFRPKRRTANGEETIDDDDDATEAAEDAGEPAQAAEPSPAPGPTPAPEPAPTDPV